MKIHSISEVRVRHMRANCPVHLPGGIVFHRMGHLVHWIGLFRKSTFRITGNTLHRERGARESTGCHWDPLNRTSGSQMHDLVFLL